MKLSVIIPTYNRINFLKQCLESIRNQEPSVYEVIIVDDNSTDDTVAYCEKLKHENNQIKFVIHRNNKNEGAQYSRNLGLSLTTGSAVMFIDSDDVLYQKNLSSFVNALSESPELDYVYGQVLKTNAVLTPLVNVAPVGYEWDGSSDGIAGYHWHTMGALYKKDYLQKVGFWDDKLTGSQDWEYQARVKLKGGLGKFIPSILGLWRDHEEDRIGTKSFRYSYVQSVIIASSKIALYAKEHQQFSAELAQKLARKILMHALEYSVNSYKKEKGLALDEALEILDKNRNYLYYTLKIIKQSPTYIDKLIWQFINRK